MMDQETTPRLSFEVAGHSDKGGRRRNEDRWLSHVTEYGALFVVLDGAGVGMGGGEVAEVVRRSLLETATLRLRRPIFDGHEELVRAFLMARREVGQLNGATTATALLLAADGRAWVAQVGDSALYRITLAERIREIEDPSTAPSFRQLTITDRRPDGVVDKTIGGVGDSAPSVLALARAQPGDVYLLATDGVGDAVHPRRLAESLAALHVALTPRWAAEELVGYACEHGKDNATALVVHVRAVEREREE